MAYGNLSEVMTPDQKKLSIQNNRINTHPSYEIFKSAMFKLGFIYFYKFRAKNEDIIEDDLNNVQSIRVEQLVKWLT